MIWRDRSTRSVVVGCTLDGWRDVATTPGAASRMILEHVDKCHPHPEPTRRRALTASRVDRHRRRHADTPTTPPQSTAP